LDRNIVQRDAAELAGTPRTFRFVELASIVAFAVLWPWLLTRLVPAFGVAPLMAPLAILAGYLGADFISGFFHWLFDTWWRPETPVIGRVFVRTFREHHVDPTAITRHDFVETNGSNILAGAFLTSLGFGLLGTERSAQFLSSCMLFAGLFMAMTSQIHKWAHMDAPPAFVRLLQRSRILLSKEAHARHHEPPYVRSYCITCGWLNGTLHFFRFFQVLERLITAVSGKLPRADDIGTEAALALVEAESDGRVTEPRTRPR
jgi:ubiquitin-conjugating enzyme E2 variant